MKFLILKGTLSDRSCWFLKTLFFFCTTKENLAVLIYSQRALVLGRANKVIFTSLVECAWLSKPRRKVPHGLVVVYKSIRLFLMLLPRRCKYQLNYKMCSLKNKQIQNKNKSCQSLTRRHSNPYLFLASWCPKGRKVPDYKSSAQLHLLSSHAQLYGQVFTCLRKTT